MLYPPRRQAGRSAHAGYRCKPVNWSNRKARATVRIPYTPTADELENSECIIVRYFDGSGNVKTIPNGWYITETGPVIFANTHFSYYGISWKQVIFDDVPESAWYRARHIDTYFLVTY